MNRARLVNSDYHELLKYRLALSKDLNYNIDTETLESRINYIWRNYDHKFIPTNEIIDLTFDLLHELTKRTHHWPKSVYPGPYGNMIIHYRFSDYEVSSLIITLKESNNHSAIATSYLDNNKPEIMPFDFNDIIYLLESRWLNNILRKWDAMWCTARIKHMYKAAQSDRVIKLLNYLYSNYSESRKLYVYVAYGESEIDLELLVPADQSRSQQRIMSLLYYDCAQDKIINDCSIYPRYSRGQYTSYKHWDDLSDELFLDIAQHGYNIG